MPIDFPPSPSTGATYSYSSIVWTYNGVAWDKTTGSGNTGTSFLGYDYEIHVSQVDGNDTTGNGDLLTPVASITKALTLVGSQRKTIIVHPGTYNESFSITVRYTTITGPGLIGGNIVISGTVSTNTGCTISGIKMTDLTVTTPSGEGNVNILNCEVSGTFTKSSTADYTVLRLCDLTSANITGAGLVAIFGGNPNFITVNNASANVIIKSAVTVAPVLTAGKLSIVDCVVGAAAPGTNAVTSAASSSSVITLANSQFLTSNLSGVAPVVLNGFYSILNCVYDKPNSTLAALSATGGSYNSIDYFQYINADKFITQGGTFSQFVKGDGSLDSNAVTSFNGLTGAVTGVASIRGLTGAVGLTNGSGIGLSVSGNTLTVSNTGVLSIRGLTGTVGLTNGSGIGLSVSGNTLTVSNTGVLNIDGSTGAITNVARTNVNNFFTESQYISAANGYLTVYDTNNSYAINLNPNTKKISFSDNDNGYSTQLYFNVVADQVLTFPPDTTVLAGLASNQTFTGTNTFDLLTRFNSGISAAGDVTLSGNFSGATGSFSRLLTASVGISAAGGVTFAGTVSSDTGYRISSSPFNTQTGTTYTFVAADNGKIVTFNNGSTITVTVPTELPVGFNCTGIQLGAGQVGFTAASGVTLNSYLSQYKILGQHGAATLISYTTNVYNLSGNLTV
jgi:hypothetical protein